MCYCSYEKCGLWNPLRQKVPPDERITLKKYLENLILFAKKQDSVIPNTLGWPGTHWIKITFELNCLSPIREYIKNKYTSFSLYDLLNTKLSKSLYGLEIFKTLLKKSKNGGISSQYIRTIKYIIAKIKNRSTIITSIKYDCEFDFWFICRTCGSKLLDDRECWHAAWCTSSKNKIIK